MKRKKNQKLPPVEEGKMLDDHGPAIIGSREGKVTFNREEEKEKKKRKIK